MATLPHDQQYHPTAGRRAGAGVGSSLTSFDWVAIIIKAFAVVLIAAAMASLLGALMQALARREPEMAVLRAMGRAGWQLALLVLAEAVALMLLASLVAAVLLAVGAWLLSHGVLHWPGGRSMVGSGYWGIALIAALCLAVIATIPVLWRSVSIDVAAQLSSSDEMKIRSLLSGCLASLSARHTVRLVAYGRGNPVPANGALMPPSQFLPEKPGFTSGVRSNKWSW